MTSQFDHRTRPGISRRQALGAAGAGVIATAGVLARAGSSAAQTPAAVQRVGHLFVVVADAGRLQPADGGIFELTMTELGQRVLYFSDPPDQRSDFVDIETVISQIALDLAHTNAGLTVSTAANPNESLAIELQSASYDPATRSATFAVHLLNAFHATNWKDGFLAPTLVIDDALTDPQAWTPIRPNATRSLEGETA